MHKGHVAYNVAIASESLFASCEAVATRLGMSEEYDQLMRFDKNPRAFADIELYNMYRLQHMAEFMKVLADRIVLDYPLDEDLEVVSDGETNDEDQKDEEPDDFFEIFQGVLTEQQINALYDAGFANVKDLNEAPDKEILDLVEGVGQASLNKIRSVLGSK